MTTVPDSQLAHNRALRSVHRSVLATLAVCAVAIALAEPPETPAGAASIPRGTTYVAVALAVASIATRRRQATPGTDARTYVGLSLASLLCAGGVGIVGVAVALAGGPRTQALAFVLAGAVFALRPPAPLALRPPADRA
jgi:hypothetical protein